MLHSGKIRILTLVLLLLAALSACGQAVTETPDTTEEPQAGLPYVNAVLLSEVSLEDEAVALSSTPAVSISILEAEASGTLVKSNQSAVIDYSNTADGYVMVNHTAASG